MKNNSKYKEDHFDRGQRSKPVPKKIKSQGRLYHAQKSMEEYDDDDSDMSWDKDSKSYVRYEY